MTKRIIDQLNTEILTLKVELEEARRLAGARKGALETAEHQIDQLMKQDQWQLSRIRELETSNKERWDRIQNHERDRVRLLERLEQQGTNRASDQVELVALRDLNEGQNGIIIELRGECEALACRLKEAEAMNARANELIANAPECHCDDLQESLGNLHKAGKAIVMALPMGTSAITFIEALTRSRDLLDELAPAPAKRPPVPANDKDW